MKLTYQITAAALSTSLRQSLLGMVSGPQGVIEKPFELVTQVMARPQESKT